MRGAANMASVKARKHFGSIIAQYGLTRAEVSRVTGISTRTLDSLARPENYGRDGSTRESTAWKIARGVAQLTDQTPEVTFHALFIATDESDE